ncbi:ABC transporter permease subunit [Streptomyces stelliscabiei]
MGRAQLPLRRVHRGARGNRGRHRRRPRIRVLRPRRRRRADPWSPTSSLLLPGLPLLIILAAFLPPGTSTVILVLVVTGWAGSARVLRAQAKSIRGKDFVAAAVVTGERPLRIMFREILPQHGVRGDDHAARLRDLRHRRPGRPGIPRPRRQQRRQLGHQPVLGQQRRRADDRHVGGPSSPPDCASPSSPSPSRWSTTRSTRSPTPGCANRRARRERRGLSHGSRT